MTPRRKRWPLPGRWATRAENDVAIAIHEAAHAVAGELLGFPVLSATMGVPPLVWPHVSLAPYRGCRNEQFSEYVMLAAGNIAQRAFGDGRRIKLSFPWWLYAENASPGSPPDSERQVALTHDLPKGHALDELMVELRNTTTRLVGYYWREIEAVALELVQHGKLTGEQVRMAMDRAVECGQLDDWIWEREEEPT